MGADPAAIRWRLVDFDFKGLFLEELGWDRFNARHEISLDGRAYTLEGVAEKRGFQVFTCVADGPSEVPERAVRMKLDRELTKLAYEHLIVFVDSELRDQAWHWGRREPGKPLAAREDSYSAGQSGQRLAERLAQLAVAIDEEEQITLPVVAGRVRAAFDVNRVTKRFYDRFKTEHAKFLDFIEGIRKQGDREWYASLMLNRLMFVYFIQKRGFLDGDVNYLRNRLRRIQAQQGPNRFLSFYRQFLLRLFHEGLGAQPDMRAPDFEPLLGRIPYVNGGLFEFHQLEQDNPDIHILDEAFERLFDFFDAYQWHLDERPLRADNEINPDVLGYIFEKYVNQKQMGAYYTKEDITGYIARNTVLPFLFDGARKECAIAFRPEGEVWGLLRGDPDRYIYDAVKKGVDGPLPTEIEAGIADVSKRGEWNRPAGAEVALPTETWREHVARRTRCLELRAKLAAGEVASIDDLITYNLNIEQFAEDVVDNIEGPDLLRAFWKALQSVTILDPTCGSGAFLFAALNLLEPLYEACLERMATFVEELDRSGEQHRPERFSDFRKVLGEVDQHPNRRHFVLKSIILNNLYGVDIMEEAVEICKLRLFLKLVAQVHTIDQVEPLPDIDFNIRAGNTLVGFATYDDVRKAVLGDQQGKMDLDGHMQHIDEEAEIADRAFRKFREMQTEYGMDAAEFTEAKRDLRERLRRLAAELDRYLATEYGIDSSDEAAFAHWRASHQPFHWFVEFYGIMRSGGFGVVIGNPPYVDYGPVENTYRVRNYRTLGCGNLYAFVAERCLSLRCQRGRIGLIVPLSLTFSRELAPLRTLLLEQRGSLTLSSYDNIPDRLFTGAKESDNTSKANQQRITIFLLAASSRIQVRSTPLLRWKVAERHRLFWEAPTIEITDIAAPEAFPKIGGLLLKGFLARWQAAPARLAALLDRRGPYELVVPRTAGYYIAAYPSELARTKQLTLRFASPDHRDLAMCLINSNAFFWFWRIYGDGFDVTSSVVGACPVFSLKDAEHRRLAESLRAALDDCTVYKGYRGVDVPNVNFNLRMDLLFDIDDWIIRHVAPDLPITPEDFLWAKSNSFIRLEVPRAGNFPARSWLAGGDYPAVDETGHDVDE